METYWLKDVPTLKKRMAHLLESGLQSDCSFWVGVIQDEGRFFQAHKLILSSASPVFERMFYGSLPEKGNKPIEITDISGDVFGLLLRYIYTEEMPKISVEPAQELYYAASKYMQNHLMKACIAVLNKNLSPNNVCTIFEFAKQFGESSLEETCMEMIRTKTTIVLQNLTLHQANISTLDFIVSQENLCITSELELFAALERYAEHRFSINKRRNSICKNCEDREQLKLVSLDSADNVPLPEETDEDTEDNVRSTTSEKVEHTKSTNNSKSKDSMKSQSEDIEYFYKVFKKIRFLTLTTKEFISGPALSKLLSEGDALALLICIDKPTNCESYIPQGFSDLRKKRSGTPTFTQLLSSDSSEKKDMKMKNIFTK